jgi:hypothetical protein
MTEDQPASDFDGAWKYALEQQFDTFLAFFFPQAHAAIDWQRPVVVRDNELQQVAPEDQAGKQRVDRLVEVYRLDGEPALVLVHIEIQAQRDREFASRMFRYHARLFDRARLPVASLAILGDTVADWRPDRFGYALWGCELGLRFPMVKLLDFDEAQLAATPSLFATLTLLHRDAQATRRNPEERLRRKVTRYRALLRQGHRAEDIRVMLRLMEHLLRLGPSFTETARTAMRQVEVEETGMDTFVTSFEEIGKALGRVEGRVDERRDIVLRQLDRKIGPLSTELRAQVAALAPEVLLELSDALLDFTSVDQLTDWLQQR